MFIYILCSVYRLYFIESCSVFSVTNTVNEETLKLFFIVSVTVTIKNYTSKRDIRHWLFEIMLYLS